MVRVRRNGGLLKKRSMLVWDQFRAHLTDEVKRSLKESDTISTVIPGGLTGMLQPLDVSLNRPFKTHMRKQWTLWMADGMAERTAKGNFKRPPLPIVASWAKNAWDMISKEMIKKSFLKCCISNALDGTEDDAVWQEDINETENEDSAAGSENENQDEEKWDDDNVMYTMNDWKDLFGDSDSNSEYEFEGF